MLLVFYCSVNFCHVLLGVLSSDAITRDQTLGCALVLVKSIPMSMGFRFRSYLIFISCSCASYLSAMMWLSETYEELDLSFRMYANVVGVSVVFTSLGYGQMLRDKIHFNVQEELSTEKDRVDSLLKRLTSQRDSLESLLVMLTDATAWLAEDGDTILKCDRSLEVLMGQQMEGRRLSEHMPVEEEWARFQAALLRLSSKCEQPTQLMPCTLGNGSKRLAMIEIFLAGKRADVDDADTGLDADTGAQCCFLIGIRVDFASLQEENDRPLSGQKLVVPEESSGVLSSRKSSGSFVGHTLDMDLSVRINVLSPAFNVLDYAMKFNVATGSHTVALLDLVAPAQQKPLVEWIEGCVNGHVNSDDWKSPDFGFLSFHMPESGGHVAHALSTTFEMPDWGGSDSSDSMTMVIGTLHLAKLTMFQ